MRRQPVFSMFLAAPLMVALVATTTASEFRLSVKGTTTTVLSSSISQRTDPTGAVVHEVTVTMRYSAAIVLLETFFEAMRSPGEKGDLLSVKLMQTMAGGFTEERAFGEVVVRSISVPALDVRQQFDELTVTVTMEARSTGVRQSATASTSTPKLQVIAPSQFRAEVSGLPSDRIVRVDAHALVPCMRSICDSVSMFQITVSRDIGPWREWVRKATADPGFRTAGRYSILTKDLSRPIVTVELSGVRPVSFTEFASADAIPSARIVMLAESARLDVH